MGQKKGELLFSDAGPHPTPCKVTWLVCPAPSPPGSAPGSQGPAEPGCSGVRGPDPNPHLEQVAEHPEGLVVCGLQTAFPEQGGVDAGVDEGLQDVGEYKDGGDRQEHHRHPVLSLDPPGVDGHGEYHHLQNIVRFA